MIHHHQYENRRWCYTKRHFEREEVDKRHLERIANMKEHLILYTLSTKHPSCRRIRLDPCEHRMLLKSCCKYSRALFNAMFCTFPNLLKPNLINCTVLFMLTMFTYCASAGSSNFPSNTHPWPCKAGIGNHEAFKYLAHPISHRSSLAGSDDGK